MAVTTALEFNATQTDPQHFMEFRFSTCQLGKNVVIMLRSWCLEGKEGDRNDSDLGSRD